MKAEERLHTLINYLLTKAIASGKPRKKTVLKIPYKDLAASVGKDSYQDIDLVVTISMKWDEHKEPLE